MNADEVRIEAVVEAPWFGRLRHFRSHLSTTRAARGMIAGLGRLPDLHTLELPDFHGAGVPGLVSSGDRTGVVLRQQLVELRVAAQVDRAVVANDRVERAIRERDSSSTCRQT